MSAAQRVATGLRTLADNLDANDMLPLHAADARRIAQRIEAAATTAEQTTHGSDGQR